MQTPAWGSPYFKNQKSTFINRHSDSPRRPNNTGTTSI
jgi:hypothetical protein